MKHELEKFSLEFQFVELQEELGLVQPNKTEKNSHSFSQLINNPTCSGTTLFSHFTISLIKPNRYHFFGRKKTNFCSSLHFVLPK